MKMTGSSISILGLYQFDPTIFDNLQLPDGLDKDELVSNILIEGADLEVLYPNADFIKAGAPARGERVAKYNRLLEIEKDICSL